MKHLKDILKVFNSNMIMLLSNTIITIILPIILSVSDYGQYRQYILYISYIGLLHLGYIDGIYMKYGGKDLKSNREHLRGEHRYLIIFQLFLTMVLVVISFLLENIILLLLSLSIIPINVGGFHKMLYQSTGQFSKYAKINILFTIINLTLICILFVFGIDNPYYYICSTLATYTILFIIMETDFFTIVETVKKKTDITYSNHIRIGMFILLGNLSILLINNMGLWIVNIFYSIKDFAQFSFATSMLGMILMAVSAVGLTFYNYFAKIEDIKIITFVKNILLILGVISGAAYFILKVIIGKLFPEYLPSLDIISISFINLPYVMVINVIIINLYKARKKERKFFTVVFILLVISFVLNLTSYFLFNSLVYIAISTLFTYIFWYFICIYKDFKFLKVNTNEGILLTVHFLSFLLCSNYLNWIYGFIIYIIINICVIFKLYKKDILKLMKIIKK